MKLLLAIILLTLSVQAQTPSTDNDPQYLARIRDIRARFGYDERDAAWRAAKCVRFNRNAAYQLDTRRNRETGHVELGHKFLTADDLLGPCIAKGRKTNESN